jgi:hypothetical protein
MQEDDIRDVEERASINRNEDDEPDVEGHSRKSYEPLEKQAARGDEPEDDDEQLR